MAACGVSPSLFGSGDGTSAREAYRQLLFSTVLPLAKVVEAELKERLHPGITLGFRELRAADVQARSRSYKALTDGGFSPQEAAEEVGFTPPKARATPPPEPATAVNAGA